MWLYLALSGLLALGQAVGQTFEVASVKPSTPDAQPSFSNKGDRIVANAHTLKLLIARAYGVRYSQIEAGPDWISTAAYDIQATAAGSPAAIAEEQLSTMLRALLEDRFQLKVHRKSENAKVYSLVVAKNGPKLQESTSPRKSMHQSWSKLEARMLMTKQTMDGLARSLGTRLDRPVIERTGLTGEYDIDLQFALPNAPSDSPLPSIFTAVTEKLGLQLQGENADIETLVIDSVTRPSGN